MSLGNLIQIFFKGFPRVREESQGPLSNQQVGKNNNQLFLPDSQPVTQTQKPPFSQVPSKTEEVLRRTGNFEGLLVKGKVIAEYARKEVVWPKRKSDKGNQRMEENPNRWTESGLAVEVDRSKIPSVKMVTIGYICSVSGNHLYSHLRQRGWKERQGRGGDMLRN